MKQRRSSHEGQELHEPGPELRSAMQAWGRHQAALAAEMAGFFGDTAITMAQMRALGQICHRGRMSGRELAARLGVTPGSVVPLADRLEEQGFLRRVPDADDRRLTWLEATEAGLEFFRRLHQAGAQKVGAAMGQLTAEELGTLAGLLNRIADDLEAHARTRRDGSSGGGEESAPPHHRGE